MKAVHKISVTYIRVRLIEKILKDHDFILKRNKKIALHNKVIYEIT